MSDLTDRELIEYLDSALSPVPRATPAPAPSRIEMAREILHLRNAIRDHCVTNCHPFRPYGRHAPECLIDEIEN
jgi:hypothetical protein